MIHVAQNVCLVMPKHPKNLIKQHTVKLLSLFPTIALLLPLLLLSFATPTSIAQNRFVLERRGFAHAGDETL